MGERDMSNCHIHAEGKLQSGDAEWICFRRTQRSKLVRWYVRQSPWLKVPWSFVQVVLLFPVGTLLRIISGILMHVSELLISGGWLHGSWITFEGEHWEYVPTGGCPPRWLPPLVFNGREREVKK